MQKIKLLLFFLFIYCGRSLAGESDSLSKIYAQENLHDSVRINAAIDASKLFLDGKNDSAFYFVNKAWLLLHPLPSSYHKLKSQANIFYVLGSVYVNRNNTKLGLYYLNYSLAIFLKIKHRVGSAYLLNNIGLVYNDKSDYTQAITYYLRSLKIKEQLGNKRSLAFAYLNLGLVYYSIQDYDKALEYYNKALVIFKLEEDKQPLTILLYNMGVVYFDKKEYSTAIQFEEQSLDLSKRIEDKESEAKAYSNLGSIYLALGDFNKAKNYANAALNLFLEIKNIRATAGANSLLAEIELQQKRTKNAIEFGNQALSGATEVEDLDLSKDVHKTLYKANKLDQNFNAALKHLEEYSSLMDSIFRSDKQKQIVRQELNYEFEKKEERNKVQQEKKDIESKAKARLQRIIIYTSIVILLLVIIFSVSLYRRFLITRKQNTIIEEQKKLVEEKQREVISSITYARKIQNALLASEKLLVDQLQHSNLANEYFLFFRPKDIVSGDFYWAAQHQNNFYLAICDSTGHGVPGAFMSLLNSNYLREAIIEKGIAEPNLVFDHVRNKLQVGFENEGQKDGMDAILLRFYSLNGEITYASANNRSVLIRNNEIIKLNCDKMPVGKGEVEQNFSLFKLQTQKNDMLYLFTDGYADQFGGASGKKFMYKQLNDFLISQSHLSASNQATQIASKFDAWKGNLEQVDDVTLMGIQF